MAKIVDRARLRQAVDASGMTQAQVAESVGISKQLLTHWIQGRRQPSETQLRRVAEITHVDVSFITGAMDDGPQPDVELDRVGEGCWAFREAPKDGGRDYGNANELAFTPDIETLVRELGQNSLDQLLRPEGAMHLQFSLIDLTYGSPSHLGFLEAMKWEGLKQHINAAIQLDSRLSSKLKRGIAGLERLRLLRVGDFGTTGAYGPEHTSEEPGGRSPFAALIRDNLNSSKVTNIAGGTFGAGKGTAWQCSDIGTVLLASRIAPSYLLDGQSEDALRFIGKSELTWHERDPDHKCAGPGWLARKQTWESMWLPASDLGPLFLDRSEPPDAVDAGGASGTSLLIVGFRDPQDDGEGDAEAIVRRINRAVAENFFPAILAGRMAVTVERHVDGTRLKRETVEPSSFVPEMVSAYNAHRAGEIVPSDKAGPGDTTHARIIHPVPKTRRDSALDQFEDLDAAADLVVRFAKGDETGPTGSARRQLVNHVALVRGRLMVVDHVRKSNLVVGGRAFHAMVLAGEAAGDGREQAAAEQFLRLTEPPAHNKWTWRDEVRDNYRLGAKQDLNTFRQRIDETLRELIRPEEGTQDEGPEELRKLLVLSGPMRTTTLAVLQVKDQSLSDGRWRVVADVAINDRRHDLVLSPMISVQPESGRVIDLEWESLEVVRATKGDAHANDDLQIEVPARTTRLVLEGVSKPRTDGLDLSRCKVVVRLAARPARPPTAPGVVAEEESTYA